MMRSYHGRLNTFVNLKLYAVNWLYVVEYEFVIYSWMVFQSAV